jgi:ssDNA-binding Zn-finger/Zn-ribbon topoisomerase 1
MAITIPYARRHQARHGDIIDSTKRAKGLRKCPKCGRYGQRAVYVKHGTERYIHKERYDTMYYTVTDSCHIPADGLAQEPEQGRKIIEQEIKVEREKSKHLSRMVHGE